MAIMKFAAQALAWLLLVGQCVAGELPIWELEGSDNRVLLMGSVHYLRPADYPLPEGITNAYEASDKIVMEVDLSAVDPMATQALLMSLGTSTSGSLREQLGASTYSDAKQRAEKLGIPFVMFEQMQPWFAALTITQLRLMQLGFDPAWGIETRMMVRADEDGKSIQGLETLEEQLGFMAGMDADSQREFLMQSLDEAEVIEGQVSDMVNAWRTGDAARLETLMLDGFEAAPGMEDALLIRRNRNWVSPIRDLMDQPDDYLVIVGAMHLVGDNSVIAMLDDAGISARQLSDGDLR